MRQALVAVATLLLSQTCGLAAVRHIPIPGVAPDVAMGANGEVYITYARDQNAYFVFSTDGGRTLSAPIRLNQLPQSVMGFHERGPRIALGPQGTVNVIWMNPKSDALYYTRRVPGAKTFSPPRNLLDATTHLDGATLAADLHGNVFIAWLDARLPADPKNPVSLPIFWTVSHDEGRTFSRNQPLETDHVLRACACCTLKALAGGDGEFFLGFRGAAHNIRDMYLARFSFATTRPIISAAKVHDDEWNFDACPMSGPFLSSPTRRGPLLVSWMSRGDVYFAESSNEGRTFAAPRTPQNTKPGSQNHPLVLENARDEIFFAWEEGGDIRWQVFDRSGKVLEAGDAGALPDQSKATGFVDASGNFCLVF